MPLLTGAMSVRRYRVIGRSDNLGREKLVELLGEHCFREPRSAAKGGRNLGWVTLENLCDTDFSTQNVFFDQYFCFSLRIDDKRLPTKLVSALLDLRIREWLAEGGRERIPAIVKKEMREQLELEMLPRQLPAVGVHDVSWDLKDDVVRLFSTSGGTNETFRTHFAKTFALETRPVGPLHLIAEHKKSGSWVPALDQIGYADYRPEARR